MIAEYTILRPEQVAPAERERDAFALDVLHGLSERPRSLPSKWIYDDEGSRLFQAIMRLPEYYLTRCEQQILEANGRHIAERLAGSRFNLVELGSGDGSKTMLLLEQLLEAEAQFRYVPIDISEQAMSDLCERISQRLGDVRTEGLVADYFDGLHWLRRQSSRRNVVLFLGSNIGNQDDAAARRFLRTLWHALNDGDHVLIGFDLRKELEVMRAAYDDAQGVTAAFNLNLLHRINRELDGTFAVDRFEFNSVYNLWTDTVESYLVSRQRQEVWIGALERSFAFEAWEPIHTEHSRKFRESGIRRLAGDCGFDDEHHFLDERGWFADALWRVVKPRS